MLGWTVLLALYIVPGDCQITPEQIDDYKTVEERIDSVLSHSSPTERTDDWDTLMRDDGSFLDLNYTRGFLAGDNKELLEHSRRLDDLIRRDLYSQNTLLPIKTKECLKYMTYEIPKPTSGVLWLQVIGVPNVVWPVVFRTRKAIGNGIRGDFLNKFFRETGKGPVWNPTLRHGKNTGGNLAPRLRHGLMEHFLRQKLPKFHEEAVKMLKVELIDRNPYTGDGFRHDGCLHQHTRTVIKRENGIITESRLLGQIYNNNYGKEVLRHMPLVMWQLDGTAFDLGEELEEAIFSTFLECHQWLNRWKTVEPASVGNFIDGGKIVTSVGGKHGIEIPLKYFKKFAKHAKETAAAIHRYANAIPDEEHALVGNRFFFVSDMMAHQRRAFMASLRFTSRRTNRPETLPTGTPAGYYLGAGWLTVLVTGKELGSLKKEVFQIYDWARIPGATVQYTKNVPEVSTTAGKVDPIHCFNNVDFAGGVTNKMEGLTSMIYDRIPVALKAKKSWFFFGDVILCLGSSVSLPAGDATDYPVTTTMNQVIYEDAHIVGSGTDENLHDFNEAVDGKVSQVYDVRDGLWFHHGSVGYVPIANSGKIGLEVEEKKISGSETALRKFSLWMDHGNSPSDSGYAYAVLPAHSPAETQQFADQPTVKVLSQDDSLHAACSETLKILGMSFFSKGCMIINSCLATGLDSVCTDEQALVMLKDLGSNPWSDSGSSSKEIDCPDGLSPLKISSGTDNLPTQILQISVADATQLLENINLEFKKGETVYEIPVKTVLPPKAGDSVIMCLELY